MYVPRVGPHLEDGNLRESHHKSHKSRVPTCLSRDSLQLWFFPWNTLVPTSEGKCVFPVPYGTKKILKAPLRGGVALRAIRARKKSAKQRKKWVRTRVRTHSPPPHNVHRNGFGTLGPSKHLFFSKAPLCGALQYPRWACVYGCIRLYTAVCGTGGACETEVDV